MNNYKVTTMEILTLINLIFSILGGLVTLLAIISPLTKATWDDKVLLFLKGVLNSVKVNNTEKTILINLKKD